MSKALSGAPIPVYGDGKNVRDWLFVGDHAAALIEIMFRGNVGETYNVGGNAERTNLQVVHTICDELEKIKASGLDGSYRSLIEFVTDRPGHDFRYAIDASKLKKELGWEPTETFESGIYKTIRWYLDNQPWVKEVQGAEINAGRVGLGGK
jgi:dTDP-glucose 4,6-dehydratase